MIVSMVMTMIMTVIMTVIVAIVIGGCWILIHLFVELIFANSHRLGWGIEFSLFNIYHFLLYIFFTL